MTTLKTRLAFMGKNASRGGSMRILSYLVNHLKNHGFDSTVVLPTGGDLLPEYRRHAATFVWDETPHAGLIKIFRGARMPRPIIGRIAAGLERRWSRVWLGRILRQASPDIVIRNYVNRIELFDDAALPPCPVVCCLFMHGMMLQRWGSEQVERIATGSDYFVCEGRNVQAYAESCMGIPSERIRTVCIGVDLDLRNRQLQANRLSRASLGIPADAVVIGCLGGVVYHKGMDIWLRAAAHVAASCPDRRLVFLWIGGSQSEFEHPYGRNMRRLCHRLGLDPLVRMVGDQPEVYPYLDLCDIYTQPSREDAFPHAVLEAMAVGKPVITFEQGIAVEPGMHPDYLLRVDSQQPEPLAEGILKLLRDPDARQRLGANGKRLVEEKYRLSESVAQFGDMLRGLTANHYKETL